MPEFGSDFVLPAGGVPGIFIDTFVTGESLGDVFSPAVTEGETWVMTGWDVSFELAAPTSNGWASGFSPGGANVGAAYITGAVTLLYNRQSLSWRGAIPFGSGQIMHLFGLSDDPSPAMSGVVWGYRLPWDSLTY